MFDYESFVDLSKKYKAQSTLKLIEKFSFCTKFLRISELTYSRVVA